MPSFDKAPEISDVQKEFDRRLLRSEGRCMQKVREGVRGGGGGRGEGRGEGGGG